MGYEIVDYGARQNQGMLFESAMFPPRLTSAVAPTWNINDFQTYRNTSFRTSDAIGTLDLSRASWLPMSNTPVFGVGGSAFNIIGTTLRPTGIGFVTDNQLALAFFSSAASAPSDNVVVEITLNIEFVPLPSYSTLFNARAAYGSPTYIAENMLSATMPAADGAVGRMLDSSTGISGNAMVQSGTQRPALLEQKQAATQAKVASSSPSMRDIAGIAGAAAGAAAGPLIGGGLSGLMSQGAQWLVDGIGSAFDWIGGLFGADHKHYETNHVLAVLLNQPQLSPIHLVFPHGPRKPDNSQVSLARAYAALPPLEFARLCLETAADSKSDTHSISDGDLVSISNPHRFLPGGVDTSVPSTFTRPPRASSQSRPG